MDQPDLHVVSGETGEWAQAPEPGLLLVAVRVDNAVEVRRRVQLVLAVAGTYRVPPDTQAAVWCKPASELVASDLDALAGFVGWERVRRLNVGGVVSEAHEPKAAGPEGEAHKQEVPVDWRARSQGLEEALDKALLDVRQERSSVVWREQDAAWQAGRDAAIAVARGKIRSVFAALGLPDEEGQNDNG